MAEDTSAAVRLLVAAIWFALFSTLLRADLVQRWKVDDVDFNDVETVYDHVFSKLPAEATIYPSENYYYWELESGGRKIRGNLRLPANRITRGVSFAYSELGKKSGDGKIRERKFFGESDGVVVRRGPDRFTYRVTTDDRTVQFSLLQIDQKLPKGMQLRSCERFVMRTCDESGTRFVLLFDEEIKGFLWVLDSSETEVELYREIADGIVVGKDSGFIFYVDLALGGRRTLAAVRATSVEGNGAYDGPFDQLADNYAKQTRVRDFMVKWRPHLKGKIDRFGYYLADDPPRRVAIVCYGRYRADKEVVAGIERAGAPRDVYEFVSRGGK